MIYNDDLFRKEVLKKKSVPLTGRMVLTSPFIFTVLTYLSSLLVVLIIIFIIFAEYSRKTSISGQVYPKHGMSKIYPEEMGVISDIKVKDGQFVNKGDVLGVIYKAQYLNIGTLQDSLKEQAILKKNTLIQEINKMENIQDNKKELLKNNIENLINQKEQIKNQLVIQKNKLDKIKQNINRYRKLEKKGFISKEYMSTVENNELEQLVNINATKRELIEIENLISEKKSEIEDFPLKKLIEKQEVERILASVNQEILNIESQTESVIRANSSGFISINNFELGLRVDPSTLLLNIIPSDQEIILYLYVPSQSIGFIKNGDLVNVRYSAYPYQKFGIFKAKVTSISRSAMAAQEIKSIGTVFPALNVTNEPVYLIKAELEKEYIEINKIKKPLEIGITLDADILHEKRKLYEWIFEPLFTITNSI
ncbi:HlyD family secretion protein [Xenorhabdus bovienii]|uniref:Auxiliary transporter n=1 Tax=Xenorhabdus bovienii str. feltiae Moldova TaxID=1398200 RepID=A0A077NDS2_XENBV|nr:HlyD family efflux transporter periplasmic adaptor subunit [Xenorhabdus bovienii]CDH00352.1 Auxiliary transporter [Xenorhabdus bovienii str. feltiae Moldova]